MLGFRGLAACPQSLSHVLVAISRSSVVELCVVCRPQLVERILVDGRLGESASRRGDAGVAPVHVLDDGRIPCTRGMCVLADAARASMSIGARRELPAEE